ncbi:MAG TPA: SpoIIE family protein phosphatase, partial [Coriobacteriia bacterium]|nr:SpoIIE family protein phosphatase [Coriobacteriia bacterium]
TIPADDGEPMQLWMTRTAFNRKGEPILVLVRLDTGFLSRYLSAAARDLPSRTLLVMQEGAVIGQRSTGPHASLSTSRWRQLGPQWGSVRVAAEDGSFMQGHYNDIGGIEGIGWRSVILAPVSEQLYDTARTVAPPIFVLLVGGVVALSLSWVVSVQLARPLRDLERAALNAASGSYVRQLSTDRDDEVGRVSEAFNAVALRLNALQDLSQLLAGTTSLAQVLDGTLIAIGHLVGPGSVAIYLLDDSQESLIPLRAQGYELEHVERLSVSETGWLSRVLHSDGPITFDGPVEELMRELPGVRAIRLEVVATPLVAGRDCLGVVVVARDPDQQMSDAEREMLKTFSAQAAIAVQTSHLFEVESRSRRTAEALRSVAEQLVRPTSLFAALGTVETVIADLFSAKQAIIAIGDREVLGLAASQTPELEAQLMEVGYHALGRGREKEAVVLETGTSPSVDRVLHELGVESLLLVPIALDTDHGGLLTVSLVEPVSVAAIEFGRAIGDEIALALDNAYFYQRAITRAANLETIFRISQAVGSSLQINVVLNRVLDVVQKILSADAVALMSYHPSRRVLGTVMGRGQLPKALLHLEVAQGEDIPGQVFTRGEPVSIRDMNPGADGVARIASEHDLRSLLAVPLLARGRSIGVLMVFAHDSGAFTDEDLSTLQTFASQAALAIDTARLYSREHEVASVLQASIIPADLPDYPEVTAGSVYAPAGGEAEIGGDYYDLFKAPDGLIWIAIADVCGKGVNAATKTSMIKYVVRALAGSDLGPAAIVSRVNNMIADGGDTSDIVTLWLGRYDAERGKLCWADGGHPPGLLRKTDGSIQQLGVTGALLGAMTDAPYDEMVVQIGAGESLLLYTDGVTEARRGNIFFGEERVQTILAENAPPAEIAQSLLEAVRGYVQGELRDDVAVLVVRPRDERN